jgi:hypothetical protein
MLLPSDVEHNLAESSPLVPAQAPRRVKRGEETGADKSSGLVASGDATQEDTQHSHRGQDRHAEDRHAEDRQAEPARIQQHWSDTEMQVMSVPVSVPYTEPSAVLTFD